MEENLGRLKEEKEYDQDTLYEKIQDIILNVIKR